jgi:predicted regulator of Ras-like GTPase activity (Roadblock/LC7/MglB family)
MKHSYTDTNLHSKGEQLSSAIDSIFDPRVTRAIVVSNEDGLPIAGRLDPEDKDREYLLSAISSTLLCTGFSVGDRLEMGSPSDVKINLNEGVLLVKKLGQEEQLISCGILLKNNANVPYYEIKFETFKRSVEQILFPN